MHNDKEFEHWLRSATNGQKLDALLRGQRSMMTAQEYIMEIGEETMSELTDALDMIEQNAEADRSADSAAKALIIKLGKMIVDATAGGANPESIARLKAIGQGMVDRAADLSAAVVAGTPAETGGEGGGQSTGGATPQD